jgi:RimJ/RimL family protein N-acetyltransferase
MRRSELKLRSSGSPDRNATSDRAIMETDRLIFRRWQASDLEPFARLNADPRVMEFFPATLSPSDTETMVARMEEKFDQQGFGLWAVELKGAKEFIGFIGLSVPGNALPFYPCVEIGWRLAFDHWGHGYAQEGARAVLAFGFDKLHLQEIVSFTTAGNLRSRRVMEAIGMTYDAAADFDHPHLSENHPLRKHVLYRKVNIP